MIKEITAYKVKGNIYHSMEEARYAELKHTFKDLLKQQKYSFKGTNEFFTWFEANFNTFENLINSYCRMNKLVWGDDWRNVI